MRTFFATTLLLLCVLFVNAQSSPQFPELRIVNAYKKGVGIKKTKQLKKFAEAVDSGNMEESIDDLLSKDIHERK